MKKRQAERIEFVESNKKSQPFNGDNIASKPQANTKLHKITERANEIGLTVATYDEEK